MSSSTYGLGVHNNGYVKRTVARGNGVTILDHVKDMDSITLAIFENLIASSLDRNSFSAEELTKVLEENHPGTFSIDVVRAVLESECDEVSGETAEGEKLYTREHLLSFCPIKSISADSVDGLPKLNAHTYVDRPNPRITLFRDKGYRFSQAINLNDFRKALGKLAADQNSIYSIVSGEDIVIGKDIVTFHPVRIKRKRKPLIGITAQTEAISLEPMKPNPGALTLPWNLFAVLTPDSARALSEMLDPDKLIRVTNIDQ